MPLARPTNSAEVYTAMHFTDALMLARLTPSISTVGDAYDNALAAVPALCSQPW
jgi:transposase InsO family protein